MKALVQHLIREQLPRITAGSLLNCHVVGLHSIMLLDTPEQRIRLFIASKEHELYKNTPDTLGSLAAHPHHCNITLHCIMGGFTNLRYKEVDNFLQNEVEYVAYAYQSAILMGVGSFAPAGLRRSVRFDYETPIERGDVLALAANVIHSVYVPRGREAAWFVYEGKEDATYTSLSYSDQDLTAASFDRLYQPMSEETVIHWLRKSGLL